MKHLLLSTLTLVALTGCSSQSKMAVQFESIKSRFFKSADERFMDSVIASIRENNMEKAEFELAQISSPFMHARALAMVAHYEINENNDLISAKKTIDRLEQSIDNIPSKEDRLYSQIEVADLKHFIDKKEAKLFLEKLVPQLWLIVSPEERSRLLIRLVTLQLETERDAKTAKRTIEQTRQTIEFIKTSSIRQTRVRELENVLQVNNHILCQEVEFFNPLKS